MFAGRGAPDDGAVVGADHQATGTIESREIDRSDLLVPGTISHEVVQADARGDVGSPVLADRRGGGAGRSEDARKIPGRARIERVGQAASVAIDDHVHQLVVDVTMDHGGGDHPGGVDLNPTIVDPSHLIDGLEPAAVGERLVRRLETGRDARRSLVGGDVHRHRRVKLLLEIRIDREPGRGGGERHLERCARLEFPSEASRLEVGQADEDSGEHGRQEHAPAEASKAQLGSRPELEQASDRRESVGGGSLGGLPTTSRGLACGFGSTRHAANIDQTPPWAARFARSSEVSGRRRPGSSVGSAHQIAAESGHRPTVSGRRLGQQRLVGEARHGVELEQPHPR